MTEQDNSLGLLIATMPRRGDHEEKPPFMHTLALLEALRNHGFPCELWNAVMEGPWKILVVAGIRTGNEILDWDGHDPRQYPRIYPILQEATISREGNRDIIPGKRQQAVELHPEIAELSRKALDYIVLQTKTPDCDEETSTRRL